MLINKEQQIFNQNIFKLFKYFLQNLYKKLTLLNNNYRNSSNLYKSKIKFQRTFKDIFDKYFDQINQKQNKPTFNQQNKVTQISQLQKFQQFTLKLNIFQQINDQDGYHCSLGPKLLIHGKMKIFDGGIFYLSHFNKKNLFFGKTILFIPRQDILEIIKASALIIFPDVIQIVTKKGKLFFHSLGKRQKMVQQLNECYFNENNDQINDDSDKFNEYIGQDKCLQQHLSNFKKDLQYQVDKGEILNMNVASLFHKYFSTNQFTYQGISYKDFKYYTLKVAGAIDIQGTQFSHPIPLYFQKSNSLVTQPQINNFIQSHRTFTYKKSIPMIPFVSKGGEGVCQQKSIFRWGGPNCFIIDVSTVLKGFKLTQGMNVLMRQIFENKDDKVIYRVSCCVNFESDSAINSIMRTPALSNLKSLIIKIFEVIKKLQKHKKIKINSSNNLPLPDNNKRMEQKILVLEQQNNKLKSNIKTIILVSGILYIITIILFFKLS